MKFKSTYSLTLAAISGSLLLTGCQVADYEILLQQNQEESNEIDIDSTSETESRPISSSVVEVGEILTIQDYNDEEMFKVILTDVSYVETETYDERQPTREQALISFAVQNVTAEDEIFIADDFFKVYDKNEKRLKDTGFMNTIPLSSGRWGIIQVAVDLPKNESFEIDLYHQWGDEPFATLSVKEALKQTPSFENVRTSTVPTCTLNETINLWNSVGLDEEQPMLELKITKTEWTKLNDVESNQMLPVLIVTIEGTNLTEDIEYLNSHDFSAYDDNGKKLNKMLVETEYDTIVDLDPQETDIIQIPYLITEDTSSVELEIGPIYQEHPRDILQVSRPQ